MYSIMYTKSRLIIAQETVRVTDVKNSYWMEVEGVKRCLDNIILNDHGVETGTLDTDGYRSIRADLCLLLRSRYEHSEKKFVLMFRV